MYEFQKGKEYLICVDSDGCAMDTMNSKHVQCFGPCLVAQWQLERWESEVLARWNEINLYTLTRGINRFKGLALMLREVNERYASVAGLAELVHWVETTDELSESSLAQAVQELKSAQKIEGAQAASAAPLEQKSSECLQNALLWSKAVNRSIDAMPEAEKMPFAHVKEGLATAHAVADVVVVSSANRKAVLEEWGAHGLLENVDLVLAQDAGSKAHCIAHMLEQGYAPQRVLMIGDAPGDKAAAEENGVWYYPILVRHEADSWQELCEKGLPIFLQGDYNAYAQEKNAQLLHNLGCCL